jgi:hypothetical protein
MYFHTVRQWAAGLLLMLSLGIVGGKADFDQPHLHCDREPSLPTTAAPLSVYGNSSSQMIGFSSRDSIPENERCPTCAGIGTALVIPDLSRMQGTGRKLR